MLYLGEAGKDPMGPAHCGLARFLASRTNEKRWYLIYFLYPVPELCTLSVHWKQSQSLGLLLRFLLSCVVMLGLCRWQSYTQSPHRCLSDLSDSSSKLSVGLLLCMPEPAPLIRQVKKRMKREKPANRKMNKQLRTSPRIQMKSWCSCKGECKCHVELSRDEFPGAFGGRRMINPEVHTDLSQAQREQQSHRVDANWFAQWSARSNWGAPAPIAISLKLWMQQTKTDFAYSILLQMFLLRSV